MVLFLVGIILSGRFADLWDGAAPIFVIGGTVALTLLGFSLPRIGLAIRSIAGRPLLDTEEF